MNYRDLGQKNGSGTFHRPSWAYRHIKKYKNILFHSQLVKAQLLSKVSVHYFAACS